MNSVIHREILGNNPSPHKYITRFFFSHLPTATPTHTNKKALFDYEMLESFEAGIELTGAEVKSLRTGSANLKGAHVSVNSGRPVIIGMHITPYKGAVTEVTNPTRDRSLFLHKKTVFILIAKLREKGMTLIPTELYFKGTLVKVRVALARGRTKYDKRAVLKDRTLEKEARKALQIRI